jgi:membrane fusion protein (multidrug efflux system)
MSNSNSETVKMGNDIPENSIPESLPTARNLKKVIFGVVGAAVVVVGGFYGLQHLRFALSHEETDDAQVDGDISPVLPRTSGFVTQVLVKDNQSVIAGQPLLEVDSREPALHVASAQAALDTAKSALDISSALLGNAKAAAAVTEANVATASVSAAKTAADLARDTRLFKATAISDSQLSDSQAAADLSKAQLEAAKRQAEAAKSQVAVAESQVRQAQAQIHQRESDLDFAKLELTYTTVSAPISGVVSHKNVEPGQYVQAGQTLFSVASESGTWVVANFKETQLTRMHPGQPVEFTVDAYPGVTFRGKVDSIAGATGARFALLPPDNASGNFVKVTQRLPVKIVLADPPEAARPLRPGMSVDAAVDVGP